MAPPYLVFFNFQSAGDATAGYKWSNFPGKEEASFKAENVGNPVEIARVVEVTGGASLTEEEACKAVRKAYGDSLVAGSMKVATTANVKTETKVT